MFPGGVQALRDVNLKIGDGEFIVVVGLSGAGKSTLLRSINRLVEPTGGSVLVDGEDILTYNEARLKGWRSQVGMIFQQHNLVKRQSVLKNVLAGALSRTPTTRSLLGIFGKEDVQWALRCLELVEITDKAYVRADALSGGQQQRVSIARALCQRPKVILADEPVASLDPPTSHVVLRDLKRINREQGITTLVNLHYIDMALEYAERIIGMRAGQVVFDGRASDCDENTFEQIYGRRIKPDDVRSGTTGPLAAVRGGEG